MPRVGGPAEYLLKLLEDKYEVNMNKQSTIDKIKVMQAYVDGEEVEFKSSSLGVTWQLLTLHAAWNWALNEYRIKPTAHKMTVADISELLGYEVEVVAG